ncbi:MAG: ATP-binding protein [Pseudomonadota bacterium]
MNDGGIIRLGSDSLTAAAPEPANPGDFSWRVQSGLAVFRLLIAVLLMATFAASSGPRFFGELYPQLFLIALLTWFVAGIIIAIACVRQSVTLSLLTQGQLIIDITAIAALSLASGGVDSGIAGLLIIFIGAAAFVLRGVLALFFAAMATLSVLGVQAWLDINGQSGGQYPAAGLLSAVLFAVVLSIRPLVRRLAQSEALARQQVIDIANLAELNRYVVQHLREAIIVIDGDARVRLMNDAASNQLGIPTTAVGESLLTLAPDLAAYVETWRRQQQRAGLAEMTLLPGQDGARLQVHVAPFGDNEQDAAPLLLFLEDVSVLAERVQQSKLASLGRLSASIAHEIRNPIGAMSHAAQLLGEQQGGPTIDKLSEIIHRNAERVSSIVEDIMNMSRRDGSRPKRIVLAKWLTDFCQEYNETNELAPGTVVLRGEEAISEVVFDAAHLRQVLRNLLDNARMHAHAAPGQPVEINWGRVASSRRPFLEIADRGPGISEANRDRVFEPFFTQHDDGTGLGLYLCQELCELNRASLSARERDGGGSVLSIVFADPARWGGAS